MIDRDASYSIFGLRAVAVVGLLGGLLGGLVAAPAAEAASTQTLSYKVLKEGEPVGKETVSLTQEGDRLMVEVATETRVKVLFLDFHYNHHRTETWVQGHLERMVADTDDDGAVHHLEIQRTAGAVKVTVDGKGLDLPPGALPLTLWGKAPLDRPSLYSIIDAEPYKVSTQDLGAESLSVAGRQVTAEHYRMAGDVERDLWYGPDGYLVKVAFQRRGYPIQFVRE